MSKQTQILVNKLEAQIEELTLANRQIQSRTAYLETSVQLSQAISSTQNLETLTKRIVEIFRSSFGLYHIGIYLIDSAGKWAVLTEAAGKASRKLKKEGYRLPVDEDSLVGWLSKNQKPYFLRTSKLTKQKNGPDATQVKNLLLPRARSEVALPLIVNNNLIGILDTQSLEDSILDQDNISLFQALANQIAPAVEKAQSYAQAIIDRNTENVLSEISTALNADPDIEAVTTVVINLGKYLDASSGEIYLLTDTGDTYIKSSLAERNNIYQAEKQDLVHWILTQGPEALALKTQKPLLIADTTQDESWQPDQHRLEARSVICVPIVFGVDRLKGALSFVHSAPNHFKQKDLNLLEAMTPQLVTALKNAVNLAGVQNSLHETRLMLDISRNLSGASNLKGAYDAMAQSIIAVGADHCTLYMCDELDNNNLPIYGQVAFASDSKFLAQEEESPRFLLKDHPTLYDAVHTQDTLVFDDIKADNYPAVDRDFFLQPDIISFVINPLMIRSHVAGLLSIEYRTQHRFTQRELALYQTFSNQTTLAIEHIQQLRRTEEALAETQTLYRAGRVLAGAADLQGILEEALIEFVYSLHLNQGGVTLITTDGQFGQLMAYLERGQLQDIDKLRFPIDKNIPYQEVLLAGQPFVSSDVANDPRLVGFRSFNSKATTTALLEAPIIIQGETIGWIGADAVGERREFKQREVDMARAMSDQIAIAIQNRRLLEQTEYQAKQLKAVATVGETVTGLMDLDEVLKVTVDLIRDQFNYHHVSIFLLDETQEWAVVRASTGEVGKIMVQRPHRLGVGSNSIVGFATAHAKPRIALDVGKDAVHFNNPLLPKTRSEMALPLLLRGVVIGALDVQSEEPNAFTHDDVETLQIMVDQVVAAIQNARLFEQTQRRLIEQAMLYRIGTKIGRTLNLQETTDILASETAEALDVAESTLTLYEEGDIAYVISDYVREDAPFENDQGKRFSINEFDSWSIILETKQEFIAHIGDPDGEGWEFEYLRNHRGTALAIVPIQLRNQVIGLLEIYDDKPGRRFKQEDIALLDSIALQAANAIENAQLFAQTQKTLQRTQTLHRIGNILATTAEPTLNKNEASDKARSQQAIFETVLGEYLQLLGSEQGSLILFDKPTNSNIAQARYIGGKAIQPNLIRPVEEDLVFQHLIKNPTSLVIEDVSASPLIKQNEETRGQLNVISMLFIPLMIRGKLSGNIVVDATDDHVFTQGDIEIGEAIADQLNIWLENRQLLAEAQYRSERLQTAAEVSRAASSILDINELIDTSVNLIRDHFDFYYVGLFLVDEAREWAVLRAGTGEPGRIQLERNHRLKIGGGSMIGWSVANREARIALDVGEEAVRFKNPILPDTHSEMALPLVSRDEVIGALTVQSVERGAFSGEDIVLLQTMADQLANAIENASLFSQTQEALAEAETLYHITQQLSSVRDEEKVYEIAIDAIAGSGVDSSAIYMYVNSDDNTNPQLQIEQKAVWAISGEPDVANGTRFQAGDFVMEQVVPRQGLMLIEDINDPSIANQLRQALTVIGITSLMALPLSTYQNRLGFLLAAYKHPDKKFTQNQTRFFTTIAQQMVTALENLRLLGASQRRARREEIIREITSRIRNAVDIDDILKTTITELGKVVGTSQGNITLGVGTLPAQDQTPDSNGSKNKGSSGDNSAKNTIENKDVIGSKESDNGQ